MTDLLDRRLLFVTGKGGVGKTLTATALGVLAAERGLKTLVAEVDGKGDVGRLLGKPGESFDAREVRPGLSVMTMNTEDSLREYLKLQVKVPVVGRIGPVAKAFEFLGTAAPGVREVLTIGKLTYEVRENHYDLVVVDAVASGHIIGQLAAPRAIGEMVQVGLIGNQTQWMTDMLEDPEVTAAVLVALPEEMPIVETLELAGRLENESGVDIGAVVVNRVLPELFTARDQDTFDRLAADAPVRTIAKRTGLDLAPLVGAAQLASSLRRTRAEHLRWLREQLDNNIDQLYLPELFTAELDADAVDEMAAAFGAELGYA